ncbi:GerMN domain-containing protein [Caldalkalibacillus salinus]|uniref:GerMN domain-containing protein n=1 Tax=Caldalkalibacillus salinus TaxID=2803787 RepID=UPI003B00207F
MKLGYISCTAVLGMMLIATGCASTENSLAANDPGFDESANTTETDTSNAVPQEDPFTGYDITQKGEPFSALEKAITKILNGEESSLFNEQTAGMLNGVSIMVDGTTVVDFKNLSDQLGALSTAEKGQLAQELNTAVFQFEQVSKVYYQFDGSFIDWCHWLEIVEEPVTRGMWESSNASAITSIMIVSDLIGSSRSLLRSP